MAIELSPFQLELIEQLSQEDYLYRARKANARKEAIAQADKEIRRYAEYRALSAARAINAGIPRSVIHKQGLHTSDAQTLTKLIATLETETK